MIVLDFFAKGGIFMWPLFIAALLAFYLILFKIFQIFPMYLRYKNKLNLIKIRQALKDKQYSTALEMLSKSGPVEKILEKGISYLQSDFDEVAIKDRLEMIYEEELHNLERSSSTILILGEIMPMLGLLGTVSGMIQVFKAISVYGAGDANTLASGISEALITTETGLVLAIPILFLYTLLNNHIDKITKLMRQSAAAVITSLRVVKKRQDNNV
jgi:biopolymer transport protein ExbB